MASLSSYNMDEELMRRIKELEAFKQAQNAQQQAKANTQAASLGQWNPKTGAIGQGISTAGMSINQAYTAGLAYAQNAMGMANGTTTNTKKARDVRSVAACIRQINNLLHTIKMMKGQPIV